MNNEIPCNIVSDLLPLYVDNLTSESTNLFIKQHLEECSNCQKEYLVLKGEWNPPANKSNNIKTREINYLKKISLYQKINLILGAIISFLFGACMPILKIGMQVFLNGTISEYHLTRLRDVWHIYLFKMGICGIVVCIIYLLIMFVIRKKVNKGLSQKSQRVG